MFDHLLQGVSKKTHHKEMRDFLTLKMLPLALSLIKPEKRHLLAPLVKTTHFTWEIVLITKFSCKIGGF